MINLDKFICRIPLDFRKYTVFTEENKSRCIRWKTIKGEVTVQFKKDNVFSWYGNKHYSKEFKCERDVLVSEVTSEHDLFSFVKELY